MKNQIQENIINEKKDLILNNSKRLLQEKEVIQRYGSMFNPSNLNNLTKDDFKSFLLYKNNKHWESIHRQGNIITKDMSKLRKGLAVLLDESRNLKERLDFLFPSNKPNYIKGLGKAIATPVLMVVYPDKYGVWNSKSTEGLKRMGLLPKFKTKDSFSHKYIKVNNILNNLSQKYSVTLWQLDEIIGWIALGNPPIDVSRDHLDEENITGLDKEDLNQIESYENFGLEKHLEDFLIENWEKLEISKKYSILEENGDIIGQQYYTDVGIIDILAKSKDGKEWLIIELKKGRTSDRVVGQTLKYIGWISEEVAKSNEEVKGLIIAGEIDEKLKYALKTTKNINMMTYSVNFKLSKHC